MSNNPVHKLALAVGLCLSLPAYAQSSGLTKDHVQMLDRYCSECHNFEDYAGGIAFELLDKDSLLPEAETWEKVVLKLKAGMMPPLGKDRPDTAMVKGFVADLENSIDTAWASSPKAGAPLLHRMNRTEYQNAIRDLLDLPIDAATMFPADSFSEGFDNIASVLNVSPALMQAYISAANKISRLAVGDMTTGQGIATYRADAQDQSAHLEGIALGTRGGLAFEHVFPLDAEYERRTRPATSLTAVRFRPTANTGPGCSGIRCF